MGAKSTAFGNLSLTLMLGMFLGGIPEAAASASMLTKAGYAPRRSSGCGRPCCWPGWPRRPPTRRSSAVGRADDDFVQALAGGAVFALGAPAMIPVALEEGGSLVVLPTVAGVLFVLYLVLPESFV